MSKVSRVLQRWAAAIRRRWHADTVVAHAMGWTVEPGRFGSRTYRDPRFDRLAETPARAETPGRWS